MRLLLALALAACWSDPAPQTNTPVAPPRAIDAAPGPNFDDAIAKALERLHAAGDKDECDPEKYRLVKELAAEQRFTLDQFKRERENRNTAGKGPMPYPSPGTACAIFGIQSVLDAVIDERTR